MAGEGEGGRECKGGAGVLTGEGREGGAYGGSRKFLLLQHHGWEPTHGTLQYNTHSGAPPDVRPLQWLRRSPLNSQPLADSLNGTRHSEPELDCESRVPAQYCLQTLACARL